MAKIDGDIFKRWNRRFAEMAAPDNHSRVPDLLIGACDLLLPSDSALVAVFGESIKPVPLYDNLDETIRPIHIDTYVEGTYLLDPYYRAGVNGIATGLYRLGEVAPAGFRQSEYYRRYYRESRIIDEVGFVTQFPDGCFSIISLAMHEGSQRFRGSAIKRLLLGQTLVHQVMTSHWDWMQQGQDDRTPALHSQLEMALRMFGNSVLTAREAEVVRLYMAGHSTRSISERLEISTHTVSMHRKNAYSRLDITSQFELFHMFIDSLSCFDAKLRDDPLRRYLGIA